MHRVFGPLEGALRRVAPVNGERRGPAPVAASPPGAEQRWNVWDLDRLARASPADDAARHEERTLLLLYLRDFAGPDGLLPGAFDRLVRDTFGELIGAR